jgi:hypothetical protein
LKKWHASRRFFIFQALYALPLAFEDGGYSPWLEHSISF